ncbi:MAG: nitrilase-related carbon-nitrogen hydrolase [Armatimonadota bacterium]|nr:nitrilase-related carbon-nitrogen hydrolase [Armatimonadota bacterium]
MKVRVAVIQMAGCWDDPTSTRERIADLLGCAADAGAALAVLPELSTVSYDFCSRADVESAAEPLDGPTVQQWTAIAAQTGMHLVAGLPERLGMRLYNTAVLVGPAGLVGAYRKAHLYHHEREVFDPGDAAPGVWQTPLGRIGMLICYDLRFAEVVRLLMLRGAHIVCVPTTWTDRGKSRPWDDRGWCGADYLAAGHAYGSRLWIACANRAGQDGGVRALGCSGVFAPSGFAVAGPGPHAEEALLVADCDLHAAEGSRRTPEMDLVADRRPELYGELARATSVVYESR